MYILLLLQIAIRIDDFIEQYLDCLPDRYLLWIIHINIFWLWFFHCSNAIGNLKIEPANWSAVIAIFDDVYGFILLTIEMAGGGSQANWIVRTASMSCGQYCWQPETVSTSGSMIRFSMG